MTNYEKAQRLAALAGKLAVSEVQLESQVAMHYNLRRRAEILAEMMELLKTLMPQTP